MELVHKMSMKLISTVATTGSQQIIDFTNIPQTYTDLLFMASIRNSNGGNEQIYITINGAGGAGSAINNMYLIGDGSGRTTYTSNNAAAIWESLLQNGTHTSNVFGNMQLSIPNYSLTSVKAISIDSLSENLATAAQQRMIASRLTTTAPVTSLQFISAGSNFTANSTVSLYGITKGSGGATVS